MRSTGRVLPSYLSFLLAALVTKNQANYEPSKQDRSVLLYWRTPEEWGEVLHEWVSLLTVIQGIAMLIISFCRFTRTGYHDRAAQHYPDFLRDRLPSHRFCAFWDTDCTPSESHCESIEDWARTDYRRGGWGGRAFFCGTRTMTL